MPRTSPRRQAALQATKQSQDEEDTASSSPLKDGQNGNPKKSKTVKGSSSNNKKKSPPAKEKTTQASAGGTKRKQTAAKKNQEPPEKKKTKAEPQRLTERDELPKLWTPEQAQKHGSYTFKIASWNVAGLRALMRNHPEALAKLAKEHDLDVLCLQETKLQEAHLDDPKLKIRGHLLEQEGYDAYYTCSTTKKGYSGTACFVRRRNEGGGEAKTGANTTNGKQKNIGDFFGKKTTTTSAADDKLEAALLPIDENLLVPTEVTYSFGKSNHDGEGRIICLDFPLFTLIALYVPNSGQKLERLDYRTKEWDMDLVQFVKEKQATRNVPVMWLGDLNVAFTNLEVWNDGAKHLDKQAGVTPQERASFQEQLDSGFIDIFRKLHPAAKGHYSYWSQRAGNREPNKGLRLDYFVADPSFFDEENSKVIARDSYMIYEQLGSDHCPVVLELEIKP